MQSQIMDTNSVDLDGTVADAQAVEQHDDAIAEHTIIFAHTGRHNLFGKLD